MVEREDVWDLPFVGVAGEDEPHAPELRSVEVDDAEAELPSEVRLPRAAAGVVPSVGSDGDLEEEGDRLVIDVGSQMRSPLFELPFEMLRASASTSRTSRSRHGRSSRLTGSLSPSLATTIAMPAATVFATGFATELRRSQRTKEMHS